MTWVPLRRWFERPVGGSWGAEPGHGDQDALCIRGTDLVFDSFGVNASSAPVRGFTAEDIRRRSLRLGDIVVEKSGGGETQPVGRVGLYTGADAAVPTNFAARLRPLPHVNPRFATYQLASLYFSGRTMAAVKQTTGIQNLDLDEFLTNAAWLPSLPEQRSIADYLDAETARIDALIAKKQQLIRLLDERWRTAVGTAMDELGAAFGWAPLKRFIKCLDGRRVPLSSEERSNRQGQYPYFGASGVIDRVDGYLFDETLVLLGEDGAQLADPDYEISFVVTGQVWVNNHAHVLRPLGSDPHFLALHLSTLDRGSFISGATREKITQDDMSVIPVPNCPLEVQRQTAQNSRQVRSDCTALIDTLGRQISLLAEHRQALITEAVAGLGRFI